MTSPLTRAERIAALHAAAKERILVLDGSWGVMIQRRDLTEEDFRGERFRDHNHPQKGNNDLLILTRPDIVADLHDVYYAAGADISETNTFSSTTIAQADYGLEDAVYDLNYEGARIAREVADRVVFMDGGRIVEEGHPDEVLANPKEERTRTFLARVL